jgi:anti-sigma factor RsiW
MVAGTHPDDLDLFDYVEGDLAPERRTVVQAHLAGCPVCAEQVRRVEAGRDALREAQFMHLPERRGEGIFMNLPVQVREPARRRALSPKQLLAVLTPVIAIAAVIGVLATSGTNSNENAGSAAAGAETAGAVTRSAGGGGAEAADSLVVSVSGPASEVVEELQRKGFDAKLRSDRVVVYGKVETESLRKALADRPRGGVEVFVRPR